MKRSRAVALAVMSVAVVSACQPPPPPLPAEYRPPVVESVHVTPEPAAPGDVVTITMDVRDDVEITRANVGIAIVPSGVELPPLPRICSAGLEQGEDRTRAVVTITCEVPTFASNGEWTVPVHIVDGKNGGIYDNPGLQTTVTFQVAGGSDDSSPPTMTSFRTDPAVLRQDTVFTLTMRVVDESPPLLAHNGSYSDSVWFRKLWAASSTLRCTGLSYAPVSSTEVDVSWTCSPTPGSTELGPHAADITVRDALGHSREFRLQVDVT